MREVPTLASEMTLRDYFAGQALVGLLATKQEVVPLYLVDNKAFERELAEMAYRQADIMMSVRDEP